MFGSNYELNHNKNIPSTESLNTKNNKEIVNSDKSKEQGIEDAKDNLEEQARIKAERLQNKLDKSLTISEVADSLDEKKEQISENLFTVELNGEEFKLPKKMEVSVVIDDGKDEVMKKDPDVGKESYYHFRTIAQDYKNVKQKINQQNILLNRLNKPLVNERRKNKEIINFNKRLSQKKEELQALNKDLSLIEKKIINGDKEIDGKPIFAFKSKLDKKKTSLIDDIDYLQKTLDILNLNQNNNKEKIKLKEEILNQKELREKELNHIKDRYKRAQHKWVEENSYYKVDLEKYQKLLADKEEKIKTLFENYVKDEKSLELAEKIREMQVELQKMKEAYKEYSKFKKLSDNEVKVPAKKQAFILNPDIINFNEDVFEYVEPKYSQKDIVRIPKYSSPSPVRKNYTVDMKDYVEKNRDFLEKTVQNKGNKEEYDLAEQNKLFVKPTKIFVNLDGNEYDFNLSKLQKERARYNKKINKLTSKYQKIIQKRNELLNKDEKALELKNFMQEAWQKWAKNKQELKKQKNDFEKILSTLKGEDYKEAQENWESYAQKMEQEILKLRTDFIDAQNSYKNYKQVLLNKIDQGNIDKKLEDTLVNYQKLTQHAQANPAYQFMNLFALAQEKAKTL